MRSKQSLPGPFVKSKASLQKIPAWLRRFRTQYVMVKNSQILNSPSECGLSIKPMKNPFLEFEFLFGLQILLRAGIKLCYSVLHKRGNVRSHRRPVIARTHCGPITALPHRLKDYVCARRRDEMKLCV